MARTRRTARAAVFAAAALIAAGLFASTAAAQERRVTINRVRIGEAQLRQIERQYRVRIADGDYWYDGRAGAWGYWGGPAMGVAAPGLQLGGRLTRDASGGARTGVFINGRELHPADIALLQTITPVMPGRYWLDANGWGGYEGGPAFFNLWAMAAQAGAGRGGNSWIHRGVGGGMGSDGKCIYYIGGNTSATVGC